MIRGNGGFSAAWPKAWKIRQMALGTEQAYDQ